MAVVSTDFLAALLTNYKAIFVNEFQAADNAAEYKKISTTFPSNTLTEDYSWLGTVPQMREWVDERVARGLLGGDFSIKNRHYEATLAVDRDTIEDDRYMMIKPRIEQLAAEAARHPDQLIFQLLNAGVTGLAYDGTEFFADTRVIGASANIDNIVAGAYAADTAKILSGIGLAMTAMRLYQDDQGRPMNLAGDTIVCAPAMENAIKVALMPTVAGTTLPVASKIKDVIVSPYLTSGATAGHDYYLLCCNQPLKPLIFQSRKTPEFAAQDNPSSDEVFMRRIFRYGVDARYNVGYADPRYAVQIDASD